jgi:hypothetical protein
MTAQNIPIIAQAGALIAEVEAQANVAMTQATMNSAVFNPALKASSGYTQTLPSSNSTPLLIGLFIVIAVIILIFFMR